MTKLAIVTTHPIQYYAPWFSKLSDQENVALKVFYTWSQSKKQVVDHKFGKVITWDIPLLEGYDYEFVKNQSSEPGSHHFKGIYNPTLIHDLECWNPDVILVMGWNFKSHLKVIRHFKGKVKLVTRGDSTLLDEKAGLKQILRRIWLTWLYKHFDIAFYVGQNNKDYYIKHGVPLSKLRVAPHAIDNFRFSGNEVLDFEEQSLIWRHELGIEDDELVLLFAGKLESKKDPEILVELMERLQNPKIRLVLVGNGPMEDKLKQRSIADNRIIFVSFQNQSKMPLVYRLGNITILPSKGPGETWGLAVNESMASSRPVIVTDKVGCAPDLVVSGETGWIFPAGNIKALETIVTNLSKQQLFEMGQIARNRIENWNFGAIVTAITDAISE
ncbi:glycosyltransferase family 4 protein [Robertkochia solimangrovi]|uniref:glycosyltransferase family 4 protein n=1 Tax=Robertkochia solimangrovi TaxID=2213046 RepID=UPI00117C0FB2|nr:glycosyltransferase family 4 protein [Robertkochia solimangrovi]TRZ44993.1 glycosyltransferase family 1 protein [Robertkochia solimangrovi]